MMAAFRGTRVLYFLLPSILIAIATFRSGAGALSSYMPETLMPAIDETTTRVTATREEPSSPKEGQALAAETFSACLLVMDENFRLPEWISYHYHTLPLRYLVVAVDPRSKHSPEPILGRFREQLNMTILSWSDSDFADWEPLQDNIELEEVRGRYLLRQRRFLEGCMSHLRHHNRTWVALWDTDEYIAYNPFGISKMNNVTGQSARAPDNMTEAGSVMRYIQDYGQETAIGMARLLVGNKEFRPLMEGTYPFDPRRFDTLRFRFHARLGASINGLGKCMLNVQAKVVEDEDLNTVRNPHRPSSLCPPPYTEYLVDSPFHLKHYIGSWEAYSFRDDSRKGLERSLVNYQKRGRVRTDYEGNIAPWMDAFFEQVGNKTATILLRDAGLDPSFNVSKDRLEVTQAINREWAGVAKSNEKGLDGSIGKTIESGNRTEDGVKSTVDSASEPAPGVTGTGDTITMPPSNESLSESFSACLLVMDENFRLSEWIAYHYHVLPLRNLVVATDPRAELSPEPVLQLFRDQLGMNITFWQDKDYQTWNPLPPNATYDQLKQRHLKRQRTVLKGCLEYHALHNRTWTAMWDTDEYISFNEWNLTRMNPDNNHTAVAPSDMSEPGSILKYVNQFYSNKKCVAVGRITVGNRETPGLMNESHPFDARRFDTLRYRYRGKLGYPEHGIGKCFLNVQELPSDFDITTPHRPVHEICPSPWAGFIMDVPFKLNHYVGSWESYSYRDDARKGRDKSHKDYVEKGKHELAFESNYAPWLNGFVDQIGLERATILLQDAGIDPSYNASFKIDDFAAI